MSSSSKEGWRPPFFRSFKSTAVPVFEELESVLPVADAERELVGSGGSECENLVARHGYVMVMKKERVKKKERTSEGMRRQRRKSREADEQRREHKKQQCRQGKGGINELERRVHRTLRLCDCRLCTLLLSVNIFFFFSAVHLFYFLSHFPTTSTERHHVSRDSTTNCIRRSRISRRR